MPSNQEARQESVRAVTGTTYDYNGDMHALFDANSIPAGDLNGRMLAWINAVLGRSFPDLPGAQAAYAQAMGVDNWDAVASFGAAYAWNASSGSLPSWLTHSGTPVFGPLGLQINTGEVVTFGAGPLAVLQGAAYSIVVKFASPFVVGARVIGGNGATTEVYHQNSTAVAAWSGAVNLVAILGSGTINGSSYTQAAYGQSVAGRSLVSNDGTLVTDANRITGRTGAWLGSDGAANFLNGFVSQVALYKVRLSDTTLKAKSVVGAQP